MTVTERLSFSTVDLQQSLDRAAGNQLDALGFGVIGFDASGIVRQYNTFESAAAGLSPERVLGHALFTVVAPCMNNYMVAQRFEDAESAGTPLDATIDYVLTLRMRPVKVKLRLLSDPGSPMRYVLVERRA
jgi:photoactive yellow protein